MIASRATLRPRSARFAALLLAGTAISALPIFQAKADETWTGTTSTNWFTASNWSNNAAPTSGDTVTIATTTPNATVINSGDAFSLNTKVGSDSGAGQLTISGDGALTTTDGLLVGDTSTPNTGAGSVLVTGAGSRATAIVVMVGIGSNGTLTIADGGAVGAFTVMAGDTSNGTIDVDGADSTLTAQSALVVNNGTSTGQAGILSVTNGATAISLGQTFIGEGAGSATATVDGAGSSLITATTLTIGAFGGSGSLTISNGGSAWTGGTTVLGDDAGSSGKLTVSDANSELTTQFFTVGNLGAGTVTISNGGSIASVYGDVAAAAGSTGDVTVDGANSTWFNASGMVVGDKGKGSLTIENGGAVFAQDAYVGVAAGSVGTVLVTGAGSTWETGALYVGGDNNNIGTDSLTIKDGGAVSNTAASIGNYAHANGTVTVDGVNSTWTTSGDLMIGAMNFSMGSVAVSNGASVSAGDSVYVGYAPDSTGTLTVSSGASVSAVGFSIATQSGSTGTLNIGAAVGDAAVAPGLIDAPTVAFGSGAGTINFNHTSNSYIFVPQISGSGTINQIAGTTDLATDSVGFTGTLNVTGGRLVVDGLLPNGLAVVSGGGILGGIGVVGGIDAESGGIVAPGNGDAIGTLRVDGNVAFVSGSTYQVQLNPVGSSDQIIGSGTALLIGGTVQVLPALGPYGASPTQYTILTADMGVFGSFAGVSGTPFLSYDLTYDPDNVYLDVARSSTSFASVGATPNQVATGAGAESLGSSSIVYDAIEVLPTVAAAQDAFDQLSGEIHASTKGMLLDDSRFIRDAATSRIDAAFGDAGAAALPVMAYGDRGPEMAAADTDRFAVWGQAFGSWGNTNSDGNAAAFDRSTGGLLAGADTLMGGWRVGLLGGYSHSSFDVDTRNSAGSSDNYHLGLYGGTNWGAIAFRGGAAYSWSRISTNRSVAFNGFADDLSANYDAGTAQVFGELAYKVETSSAFKFEPFANLAYVNVRTDGFTETGGEAALTSAASNTDATFTTLGLRGSTDFALGGINVTARGTLGWRHAFGDVTTTSTFAFAGGAAFTIAGVPIARDAAVVEAGFDLKMSANATLGLSYSGQFGNGATDNGAKANLNVSF